MKKLSVLFFLLIMSHVNWSQTNIFPDEGNVGIGTVTPNCLFHIFNSETDLSADKCVNGTSFANSEYSSDWDSNSAFDEVFDIESSNVWSTKQSSNQFDGWIAYKFSTPEKIDYLRLHPRVDHGTLNFKNFSILGSNNSTDGSNGEWITITNGLSTDSEVKWQDFAFNNDSEYLWYKIQGPAQPWGSLYYIQVAEIEMREQLSIPSQTIFIAKNSGEIGIGTDFVPSGYKLAVSGKAIMEEIKVSLQSNWPDYVFDEDYLLLNLKDLENYIRDNKHLPNIPSAGIVQKEGYNLSEMDSKLLQKIEELTLHLIEQNQVNEVQNQQLLKQESLIEKLQSQIKALQSSNSE